jgi:hypothetical protein
MRMVAGAILLLAVAIVYAASLVAIVIPHSQMQLMGGPLGFFASLGLGLLGLFFLLWGALTERATVSLAPPAPLSAAAMIGMGAGFTIFIIAGGLWLFMAR